jgi:hypothetical protein
MSWMFSAQPWLQLGLAVVTYLPKQLELPPPMPTDERPNVCLACVCLPAVSCSELSGDRMRRLSFPASPEPDRNNCATGSWQFERHEYQSSACPDPAGRLQGVRHVGLSLPLPTTRAEPAEQRGPATPAFA